MAMSMGVQALFEMNCDKDPVSVFASADEPRRPPQNKFDSKVDLQAGCAILFAAAVLSNIGSQLVFRLCEYSIEDREHRIKVRRRKQMVADLQGGALSGGLSKRSVGAGSTARLSISI